MINKYIALPTALLVGL